jgi:ligand-binding sensor domain-containing protein
LRWWRSAAATTGPTGPRRRQRATTADDSSSDAGETPDDGTTTTSSAAGDEDDVENEGFFASDLAFDADGRLWATSETGINAHGYRDLYAFTGAEWVTVPGSRIFSDPIHWELRAAVGGGVYLAADEGIAWTDGVTWELYEQEFLCGSLAVDTSGQLWATCPDFLARLVDGRWVEVPEGWAAASVAAGSDGSVWATTFTFPFELLRLENGSWATVPCEDCFGPRSILGIGADGTAWVSRGACALNGLTTFDPVTLQSTPIENVVGAGDVAFTSDGAVWLSVEELEEYEVCEPGDLPVPGLVRLAPDGSQRRYTTEDGLPTGDVHAVEVDPDGLLHVATSQGVSLYDPEQDRLVPTGPVASSLGS